MKKKFDTFRKHPLFSVFMELIPDRIGKLAVITAMSSNAEEGVLKQQAAESYPDWRMAVTVITGLSSDIKSSFVKSIVGCALQNSIVRKTGGQIHAVLHAALDALSGVVHQVPAEASLKLKVCIVTDSDWVAVAIYGDSAFYPITNHERCSLGVMHLR